MSSICIYHSPNVLSYLSDWLEIPRASLHVTLGPAFQPAITSLPDPYYLTLDSQFWHPTILIHLLLPILTIRVEPLLLLYTLSLPREAIPCQRA